jgi:hypothetical protein
VHRIDTIVYGVTGSSSSVDANYETAIELSQQSDVSLPWKRILKVKAIAVLNLRVTLGEGGGSVRCSIVDDRGTVTTHAAHRTRRAFASAVCSSTLAD